MTIAPALTGPQRAAVIVAQLSDDQARAVLGQLSERDVVALMAEMSRLPSLTTEAVIDIVSALSDEMFTQGSVRQGGIEKARRWLEDRLGAERAASVLSQLEMMMAPEVVDFFHQVDPRELAPFLADEHPQTIALVVSKLRPDTSAQVLKRLDDNLASDVVRRLATMTAVSNAVIQRVADYLGEHLSNVAFEAATVGGVTNVASVLNNLASGTDHAILARIEASDPELAAAIRAEMFLFEDVVALEDATLQVVLRTVSLRDIALALKTASPELVDKITRNMSVRAANDLSEEMDSLGPQRRSAIEAAQSALVRLVRELADADVITLGRPDDQIIT